MSGGDKDQTTAGSRVDLSMRLANGMIAVAALAAAGLISRWGYMRLDVTARSGLVGDHAPAFIGLPGAMALATAIACGARALDARSSIVLLGLRVDGATALVLSWTLVFSALVVALRALW